MNFFTPAEIVKNYSAAGRKKTEMQAMKMLILGILSGIFIALGAAATNTAGHSIENVSAMRIVLGVLFPGGLTLVVLLGGELFTGNCLISISVLEKQAKISAMIKNWIVVYIGNLIGSLLIAFACAKFGQFNYSDGGLAVFTMKLAVTKSTLPFANAFVLGIMCNMLVCLAVLASLSAKDTAGKIAGVFFPNFCRHCSGVRGKGSGGRSESFCPHLEWIFHWKPDSRHTGEPGRRPGSGNSYVAWPCMGEGEKIRSGKNNRKRSQTFA